MAAMLRVYAAVVAATTATTASTNTNANANPSIKLNNGEHHLASENSNQIANLHVQQVAETHDVCASCPLTYASLRTGS